MPRSMSKKFMLHPHEAVLAAIEYLILIALVATPLFLLQVYTSRFAGYVTATENFSFPPPYTNGLEINYLGAILPLLISIPLAVYIRRRVHALFKRRFKNLTILFLLLYAIVGMLSIKYPLIVSISTGSGLLSLEFVAGLYTFCIILLNPNDPKLVIPTAYISSAVTGVLSDLILYVVSAPTNGMVLIVGGYGLLDGDFIMPIAFMLASLLLMEIMRRRKT
jgi:hypothetical protein